MDTFSSRPSASDHDTARRRFMTLAAAGALGTALPAPALAREKLKTSARIVIAGAGAAGLTAASRLSAALDGARITLIDARLPHYYQPGFTLVGGGIKPTAYVTSNTADYIPSNVDWVQETVAEIDPEANKVVTDLGKTISYDYLIVATGLSLHYEEIDGMEPDLIGKGGIASIYNGPGAAQASWQALSEFIDHGGRGIFTRPGTEMKCAGAPLKYTFLSEDHAVRRGRRSEIRSRLRLIDV